MTDFRTIGPAPVPNEPGRYLTRDDAVMLGFGALAVICSLGLLLCGV